MLWRKYNRIIDRDQLLGWWSFSKLWIWELVDKKAWGNPVGEGFLWRLKNSQHNTQYYEFLAPTKSHSFDVFTSLHICSEQHLSTCYQFHILSLCLLMTYPLKRKGPPPFLDFGSSLRGLIVKRVRGLIKETQIPIYIYAWWRISGKIISDSYWE